MSDPVVTWHARMRWLERVKGVDVEGFRGDLAAIDEAPLKDVSDAALVPWICAYLQQPVEDLGAEILSPAAKRAVSAGATSIKVRKAGVRLKIDNGRVVTCTPIKPARVTGGKSACRKNREYRGRIKIGPDRGRE